MTAGELLFFRGQLRRPAATAVRRERHAAAGPAAALPDTCVRCAARPDNQ